MRTALSASPKKRILMRENARFSPTPNGRRKNDRCRKSTVRSVAAAGQHGGPVHSARPVSQGHGVRDGRGRKVFRVPGTAGLVRLGRRGVRDARGPRAHLRGLYAMGCGLSRDSPALRGLSGPCRQRLDVHRERRRLRVSAVLGDRLLRARSRGRRRVCPEDEKSRPGGVGFLPRPSTRTLPEEIMADFTLRVNGAARRVSSVAPDTPLLYILRNDLELNGPKFGCGLAQCGACTVLID